MSLGPVTIWPRQFTYRRLSLKQPDDKIFPGQFSEVIETVEAHLAIPSMGKEGFILNFHNYTSGGDLYFVRAVDKVLEYDAGAEIRD